MRFKALVLFPSLLVLVSAGACAGGDLDLGVDHYALFDAGVDGPGPGFGVDAALATTEAGTPPPRCSNDLHSVLDDSGNIARRCPYDQGCASGKCVPACDAAAASKSSVGCDYFVYPSATFETEAWAQACTAAFVANNWGVPVTLTVERAGQTFSAEQVAYLPLGEGQQITYEPLKGGVIPAAAVAIVMLNRESDQCPSGLHAATGAATVTGTGIGEAFHIHTDAPVVAQDIFPYADGVGGGVASATLLLPTSAWGDNYVGTTAYPMTLDGAFPWLGVVAAEDGTEVTISPKVAIVGSAEVAAGPAGEPISYTLNKGQYLQLAQDADLTGSIIKASKPVGTWAGNACADVPVGKTACDSMHQQIAPVRALGSRYNAVRYRNRIDGVEESPPWRVVGAVAGTVLTYDPPQPSAPATLGSGEMAMFNSSGPFVVRSQDDKHPFFFAGYMTGCGQEEGCMGDPEFVNVVPPDQYLSSYEFFTDPSYPDTNLVFIRKRALDGTFKDVTLDCAGTLTGWQPVGSDAEYTRFDLVKNVPQGNCNNGHHEATSTAPFGLTVWGWWGGVSYAYPAGAGVQPINDVVVPAGPR